jgi:hypothetical protein
MFAKLLKHEIKSTGGLLGILSLAALGVGVLGGFLLRMTFDAPAMSESYEVISVVSAISLPFIFLSLFTYSIGSGIYLIVRFYKHKFTDQGYLTFTLPVRTWQIYFSSLINMLLWSLIIGVTAILAFILIFFIGVYDTASWNMMMEMPMDFTEVFESFGSTFGMLGVASFLVTFVSGNVLTIFSVTLGCVVAKKHKVLASIGFYYAITMAISTITSFISTMLLLMSEGESFDAMFLPSVVVHFVMIIVGSWLSIWLMKKKLNLP